ncbi:hypothetical protein [Streptomyces sp. NPDC046985]|uniref:hypothetical protein n=1 Tax=Streptomyces sp. NPDC046985 TaxID=3155377 RepID=UPI0033C36561
MTTSPHSTAVKRSPAPPDARLAPSRPVYEMRSLRTDADRAEAAALVQDRQHWLALRGLPVPGGADVPALFQDPEAESAGLFEDGTMLACMIPQRECVLGWGEGRCLFLGHVHTLPDRPDDTIRLITLWASDAAARFDLPHVRAEAPAQHPRADPLARLLTRLTAMGWDLRGSGTGQTGKRVARLELAAEHRLGLRALIGCTIREPQSAARGGGVA